MKKILLITLCLTVAIAGASFAAVNYGSENVDILGPRMGGEGITPPTKIVKVRYGYCGGNDRADAGLSSGDVVVWDTTSADGYTISGYTNASEPQQFAGVLVTAIATAENVNVTGRGREVGYMAIKGYCLANVDDSYCTQGDGLAPVVSANLGLPTSFMTQSDATTTSISSDIGLLLEDPAADGQARVWLR